MNEIMMAISWLISWLSDDEELVGLAPGGVQRSMADPGTPTPYIIVGNQSPGIDTRTVNEVRLLSQPLYQIKAVGPVANMEAVVNASNRLDTALGGIEGLRHIQIDGGYIHACYRENPLQNDELVNGKKWTNIGGLYRIQVQQA